LFFVDFMAINFLKRRCNMKYSLLVLLFAIFALSACGEPRRTPDGHLMDRPTPSAYDAGDFDTSPRDSDD